MPTDFSHRSLVLVPSHVKARTNVCARYTVRATYCEYGPEWEKALFREALAIAQRFTLPVLLSRKTVSGKCEGSIGTCVVINRDGWIVTVGHILRQWDKLQSDTGRTRNHNPRKSAIENDPTIDRYERKRRIIALGQISQDDTDQCSAFWGVPGATLVNYTYPSITSPGWDDLIDIGIGRLSPFDPGTISAYPKFKRDTPDIDLACVGTSLCKLGFPFSAISPTWNGTSFELPPIPFTRFPIEGMFTRTLHIQVQTSGAQIPSL